ncbi:CoA binding domain protein [Acididesulfobacillus acetoxydans]|uniref:CoA binding domain protein n=1 Tax=Acididesulfobacillus acetoxydans TaxID=1561005 RepID=A0A8S0Y2W5_9FIRM|nr:CoA-binding protein [Acididesulfobacillus acetoxydans]CAA7601295.1 CoA binding domain protein [Acididesulfobacillus acetoxydans]CEJ08795.1 CoA binding domain protein [Acididesulfobacillus acetoxydans]
MPGDIQEFLSHPTWAVIGVSLDPAKYGNKVYFQLKKAGYTVYGINPKLQEIEGERIYPNLASLPVKPDAVSVVVPPKATEQVVQDCITLDIKRIWMQPGSESAEAIRRGEENGLDVIHDQCVLIQTRDRLKN